jgi:hypothetical protein
MYMDCGQRLAIFMFINCTIKCGYGLASGFGFNKKKTQKIGKTKITRKINETQIMILH